MKEVMCIKDNFTCDSEYLGGKPKEGEIYNPIGVRSFNGKPYYNLLQFDSWIYFDCSYFADITLIGEQIEEALTVVKELIYE